MFTGKYCVATGCPFIRWHQEVTVLSVAIPLRVPFPLRPQGPAADLGQSCARGLLPHTGLNRRKLLKNSDYPIFPNSKKVLVYAKHGRYEKSYGKPENHVLSTKLRCRLPLVQIHLFYFICPLNQTQQVVPFFPSEEMNVATPFFLRSMGDVCAPSGISLLAHPAKW